MNRLFRSVWGAVKDCFVIVADRISTIVHSKTAESSAKSCAIPSLMGMVIVTMTASHCTYVFAEPAVNALPTQGQVVGGVATITQSGTAMTIQQSTARAAIDWDSFNVGRDASVIFQQPNQSAVILNRVVGANPSEILGRVSANGQVFVVNPGGVYFSPTAIVNVGSLVATTHNLAPSDFMAGSTKFNRGGATASVINEGHLSADLGGYIALLAPEVRNNGAILATQGSIAMVAGENVTLNFATDRTLAGVTVSKSTIAALVENKQAILAPDGLVIISAQSADHLKKGIVNNTGAIEAKGMVSDGGRIFLEASDIIQHTGDINADATQLGKGIGGSVIVISDLTNTNSQTLISGKVSAKGGSAGGDGGFVETSGRHLKIADSAKVVTSAAKGQSGTWLLDPDGFTIAASDGDITGLALSRNLIDGNVSILSTSGGGNDGNIDVNDDVTWSANKLTLTATNHININGAMQVKGTGNLEMNTGANQYINVGMDLNGFVGSVNFDNSGIGLLKINGQNYTIINELGAEGSQTGLDLQGIRSNLMGYYALGKDIDASSTSSWNTGRGFQSIGTGDGYTQGNRYFGGTFNGLGHKISNLFQYNSPSYAGLFGLTNPTTRISNLFVANANIKTDSTLVDTRYAGILVGQNLGSVRNIFVTGILDVQNTTGVQVGGIAGDNWISSIENVLSNASITARGWYNVGGIVGYHENGSTINYAFSASTVTSAGGGYGGSSGDIAGLVSASTIANSSKIQLSSIQLNPFSAAARLAAEAEAARVAAEAEAARIAAEAEAARVAAEAEAARIAAEAEAARVAAEAEAARIAAEAEAARIAAEAEAARIAAEAAEPASATEAQVVKRNIDEQISKVIVPPQPPVVPTVPTPPPALVASSVGTAASEGGAAQTSPSSGVSKDSKSGTDKASDSAKDSKDSKGGTDRSSGSAKDSKKSKGGTDRSSGSAKDSKNSKGGTDRSSGSAKDSKNSKGGTDKSSDSTKDSKDSKDGTDKSSDSTKDSDSDKDEG
jgi:filamentous hemagglutinin family protein